MGVNGFRHSFAVRHADFDTVLGRLRESGVPFKGPVDHPEKGPFGQSVYFKDPSGNFLELLWRRDEDVAYAKGPNLDVG
jgi:catechol-2,3-dioxygenase